MKKIFCNYRYYVLCVLGTITVLALFAVPADELPVASWFYVLFSTKIFALLIGWLSGKLYKRWERNGKITELNDFVNDF